MQYPEISIIFPGEHKKIIQVLSSLHKINNDIVVYDIDDTLIDNNGKPKSDIISTFHFAKTKGYDIAIITARPGYPNNLKWTVEQLKNFGLTGYKYLFMMPPEQKDPSLYKVSARKYLHTIGHRVVSSIGDMPWDVGIYGGIGFKL
jgi:hypothetical protein